MTDIPVETRFFQEHRTNNIEENKLIGFLERRNKEVNFIPQTVRQIGYPQWNKLLKYKSKSSNNYDLVSTHSTNTLQNSDNNENIYYIPFVRESENHVNATMVLKTTSKDTTLSYLCDWEYRKLLKNSSSKAKAENFAVFFMQFDKRVFGHTKFNIRDTNLFRYKNKSVNHVMLQDKISNFASGISVNQVVEVEYCQVVQIAFNDCPYPNTCTTTPGVCDGCEDRCKKRVDVTYCWTEWQEIGGGTSNGGSGSGSGGGGSIGGNGSTPPAPCEGEEVPSEDPNFNETDPTRTSSCSSDPGWEPINQSRDSNGFLYSRLSELNAILMIDPYAITPCDSLNIMPLDPDNAFGLMYKRIAQYKLPNYVKQRIDSIKNVAPNWIVDNFALQSIDDASGPIVNCDFFPVRIKQLPTGMTAKSLIEYFRKNINSFIDPTIGVSFFPYSNGNFNDVAKFNSAYESSLGALVHIKMINDGSVILSEYYSNNSIGSEKHRFKFSTIETPLDYEHPVAGNREFGLYEDPTRPSEFTFYTMGVDRTWDITFASGNWTGAGFRSADKLWSNVQDKMIMFIKANGGQAEFYSKKSIIARPKWDDVKDYLYGNIDFATLKQRLGC